MDSNEIDKLVKNNKVVIFMKGTPAEPRCGFSNAVVQIMRMHGVKYDSHNVLENEDLREGKPKEKLNNLTLNCIIINKIFSRYQNFF